MSRWGWRARRNARLRREIFRVRLLRSVPRRRGNCLPYSLHLRTPCAAVEAVDAVEDVDVDAGGGRP